MKGFKDFVMRGNVVDLAVAFVMGLAIAAVIKSIVDWIVTPLIAALFGKPNLSSVGLFHINGAVFSIGAVLTEVLNFVFVAAAVYFIIVLPMNKLRERNAKDEPVGPTELELLSEIRDVLVARKGDPTN